MKNFFIFIFLFSSTLIFADNPNSELYVHNKDSEQDLYVKFYPVGPIFNGEDHPTPPTQYSIIGREYTPENPLSGALRLGGGPRLKYLVGLDNYALSLDLTYTGVFKIGPDPSGTDYTKWLLLGHDASQNSDLHGLFGYGKYRLEVYKLDSEQELEFVFDVFIDWLDFNYPGSTGSGNDLFITINSTEDLFENTFRWAACYWR